MHEYLNQGLDRELIANYHIHNREGVRTSALEFGTWDKLYER
jgi:hypothetical protein